jgi:hypothetical protein
LNKIDQQSVFWKFNSNRILQKLQVFSHTNFDLELLATLTRFHSVHKCTRELLVRCLRHFFWRLGSSSQIKELPQQCVRLMANVQSKHKTHNWNEASHYNSSKNWTFWH